MLLALIVWWGREERSMQSAALGEERRYTIYNAITDPTVQDFKVVIVLDGERMRHGLATAVQARFWAFFRTARVPVVVALDQQGSRDVDLRNARSQPAAWRPSIVGRAEKFDRFLIDEILPQFQTADGNFRAYLIGHSLGGLYTIDFAVRHKLARHFTGFAAFSPTFSHDLGALDRLPELCAGTTPVLMTIGWESDREHILFDRAQAAIRQPNCSNRHLALVNHPGMIHQVVMLTGQAQAIRSIVFN